MWSKSSRSSPLTWHVSQFSSSSGNVVRKTRRTKGLSCQCIRLPWKPNPLSLCRAWQLLASVSGSEILAAEKTPKELYWDLYTYSIESFFFSVAHLGFTGRKMFVWGIKMFFKMSRKQRHHRFSCSFHSQYYYKNLCFPLSLVIIRKRGTKKKHIFLN